MVLPKASRLFLMLMLLSSSSLVHANEGATAGLDPELLEFLGDTAGLEDFGLDLDEILGIEGEDIEAKPNTEGEES